MVASGEALGRFFTTQKLRLNKCLHPSMTCEQAAIRAHSIQNARVLDLLVQDGHVIAPQLEASKAGPDVKFKPIGRNAASTFTGLCAEHDAGLFKPLDTADFHPDNAEQLFLLAYRSVARELHVVIEGALKIQAAYTDRVKRGLDAPDGESPAGAMAMGHLLKAYETFQYRAQYFDPALITGDFSPITHDVIMLAGQKPTIAVSSLFSLGNLLRGDDLVRVILNIFPVSADTTAVVFSYGPDDVGLARPALARILMSDGAYQKYELSRLIIGRVENFLVAPKVFGNWSVEKVSRITEAFLGTVTDDKPVPEDECMMLFA